MEKPKNKPKRKPEQTLMEGIGFDERDLEANRKGQLSERQREKLVARRMFWNRLKWAIFIALVVILLYVISQGVSQAIDPRERNNAFFGVMLIGTIIVTLAGYAIYSIRQRCLQYNMDLEADSIAVVEGRVSLDVSQKKRNLKYYIYYKIKIGELQFAVNYATFLAFKNGDPYVIYYTPASKTILSAEWLRAD